jgi:hypothetical protein
MRSLKSFSEQLRSEPALQGENKEQQEDCVVGDKLIVWLEH